ncbi:hypothetical protein [Desulfovibrio sp. JC022]|uniref:hypothetical protein n=1 Tax=Desulfovibrio sp. JC022 TaxID=2593642 RepID=UPI0013D4A599|nr:hypothetical protein [Desulfovibrio sp. JC022]NDV21881.1 hypothetical protein [Desulfovibrio sp. JC022]
MKKTLNLSFFCLLLISLVLIQSNIAKAESKIGKAVEYMCCKQYELPKGSYKDSCWNIKWTIPDVKYQGGKLTHCSDKFIARCKSETPTETGRYSRLNGIPCSKVIECNFRLKNVDGRLECE